MTQTQMMEKLMALDFLTVDLGLYLDTHPDCARAIAAYNEAVQAADALREKYEAAYGPLCSFRSYARNEEHFDWVQGPWPWKKDANMDLEGGCH